MSYFTYILYSQSFDKFYYGQTNSFEDRLDSHNSGLVNSTKRYIPWELYAYKECADRKEAIKFERQLKNLKSRTRVQDYLIRKEFVIGGVKRSGGPENL
jgi:putative endonuclease